MKIDIGQITEQSFQSFCDISLTDCHTHLETYDKMLRLEDVWRQCRVDTLNVLATSSYCEDWISDNALCLLFKLRHPGKAYGFGSLYYPPDGAPSDAGDLLDQARWLAGLGFDGMKMLDGKPDNRRRIGIPLDSPVYDPYFDYLEESRIPLLYHVNDPAIFWDKLNVPQYVVDLKWAYLDDSFQTKEGIYREIDGILEKHPGLRAIFAHFYFMDEEGIERASAFLDRWPEASFDLTPGLLFQSFDKNLDGWRDFFIRYQDRILFGTDSDYGKSKEIIYAMRTVLETDNEVEYWDTALHGMKLPRTVLEKIYGGNFRRYAGNTPRKTDAERVRRECGRIAKRAEISPSREKLLKDLRDIEDSLGRAAE